MSREREDVKNLFDSLLLVSSETRTVKFNSINELEAFRVALWYQKKKFKSRTGLDSNINVYTNKKTLTLTAEKKEIQDE